MHRSRPSRRISSSKNVLRLIRIGDFVDAAPLDRLQRRDHLLFGEFAFARRSSSVIALAEESRFSWANNAPSSTAWEFCAHRADAAGNIRLVAARLSIEERLQLPRGVARPRATP